MHPKVMYFNKIELIKFQLDWILKDYPLNDTHKLVMAYVYYFKNKAPQQMYADAHTTSAKSIENIISTLRKMGFIIGTRDKTSLNQNIKVKEGPINFTIQIRDKSTKSKKLDNVKVLEGKT